MGDLSYDNPGASGSAGAPEVHQNIIINIDGIEKLREFAKTLNEISNGSNIYKYYKNQRELVDEVCDSVARLNNQMNQADAEHLINSFNALRSVADDGLDLSNLFNGDISLDAVKSAIEQVTNEFSEMNVISEKSFDRMFNSFDFLKKNAGVDLESLNNMFGAFENAARVKELSDEVASYADNLEKVRKEAIEATNALKEFKNDNGIESLTAELEQAQQTISEIGETAAGEFKAFLKSNNIPVWFRDNGETPFVDLLIDVEELRKTSGEAIAEVKKDYSNLLNDNSLTTSYEHFEEISRMIEEKLTGISSQSNGVSEATNSLSGLINEITKVSSESGELSTPLTSVLSIIKEISETPVSSLVPIKSIFESINNLGSLEINDTPFKTLSDGLNVIKTSLENVGNLNVLSNIRLDGLKDLKVSKASLNNLAEYLPRIANINSSNLSKLSRIDLSNFNSDRLKVSKASVDNLLSLVGVIDKLDELNKKIDTKADAIPAVAQIEEIPTIEEDIATKAEHAAEVISEMPKAEQEIVPAAEQAAQAIEDQAVAIDVVAESINNAANQAERYADAISAASSKSSNVENINIKTRTALERKSADLESRMIDQSKKFSGASPEDIDNINDYISYIQILREEYKKAKIDSNNFSSAIDDISARFSEWKVSIKESGGDTSLLTSGTKEYASAVGKLDSMLQTAITTKNSLTSIDSSKSSSLQSDIDSYIAGISNLSEELERGEITQTEFSNRSTILGHSLSSAATEAKQVVQTYRELNDAFNADTSSQKLNEQLLRRSSELQATMMNALASKSGAGEERIDELNGYINSLKNLRQQYKENIIGSEEFDSSIRRLSTSFSEWKTSIKESGNDTKLLVSGTKEYTNAVNKVDSLLQKATDAQNKFTAAKNGKSSDVYKDIDGYINRLKILDNQLESNTITQADYIKEVGNIEHGLSGAIRTIKEAGEDTQSLGDRLKNMTRSFSAWFSTTRIIMAAFRYFKQMVSASIELESSFAQLKIVTGATDEQMEQFANTAVSLAKGLGQSVSDVTKSIETFSRLGYNLTAASELSKFATILANTAAVSTEEATTGITAIIKGYNMQVSDAEHVADVLIQVGQKYAVSASEMMEAYEKSGAALNATNTTFEKSAGLIASANAAVQNASTVGTALKTVSARIRGSKTDLEELGEDTSELADGFSKYAEEIQQLTGFNIMVEGTTNEFKDLYDIMEGIASVWDQLSDTQQARVSEILGGTRQLQVISSIIGNWGHDAVGAYQDAINAAGTATRANEIYMDTTQAHINQLKATAQEMSSNIISSDMAKFVVDIGRGILEIVNGLAKVNMLLPTIVASITLVSKARSAIESAKSVSAISMQLITQKGVTDALKGAVIGLTEAERQQIVANIEAAVTSEELSRAEADQIIKTLGLSSATTKLTFANNGVIAGFKSIASSIPPWAAAAAGVVAVIAAILKLGGYTKTFDERIQSLTEEIDDLENKSIQAANRFKELKDSTDDIIPRFIELSQKVNKFDDTLGLSDEEYEEFVGLNNQLASIFPELDAGMDSNGNHMLYLSGNAEELNSILNDLIKTQRELALTESAENLPEIINKTNDLEEIYNQQKAIIESTVDSYDDALHDLGELFTEENIDSYMATYGDKWADEFNWMVNSFSNGSIEALASVFDAAGRPESWDALVKKFTEESGFIDWYALANSDEMNAALDALTNQIDDYDAKIQKAWDKIRPDVAAWVGLDSMYQELAPELQNVVNTMVAGVDFNGLGLKTEEDIERYISDSIISPIFNSKEAVNDAFASLTDASELFKNGELSVEEYSSQIESAFNNLIADMSPDIADRFKRAFVDGFNGIGIEGATFEDVIKGIIEQWSKLPEVASDGSNSLKSLKDSMSSITSESSALKDALTEQGYAGALSVEKYDALLEVAPEYASCIEYENGALQINAEKARELLKAKSELSIAEIELKKALESQEWAENTKKIEDYENRLNSLSDDEKTELDTLKSRNEEIENNIKQYGLMEAQIENLTSAYTNWLNANESNNSDNMYQNITKAKEAISDAIESGKTGIGNTVYQAAVELLIPSESDVSEYMDTLGRYITEDSSGLSNFVSDAIEHGLMNVDGDEVKVAANKTIQDFCEEMKITPDMAKAIFNALEMYEGWDFQWTEDDFNINPSVNMSEIDALEQEISEIENKISSIKDGDAVDLQPGESLSTLEAKLEDLKQKKDSLAGSSDVETNEISYNVSVTSDEADTALDSIKEKLDEIQEAIDKVAAKAIGSLGCENTNRLLSRAYDLLKQIEDFKINDKSYTVTKTEVTVKKSSGESDANGTNRAAGGKTLVGELGTELVVSGDKYYTVGDTGAEFVVLKHGDIVFNHEDTEKIMNGLSGVRGQALAYGNAAAGISGGGSLSSLKPINNAGGSSTSGSSSSRTSSSNSSYNTTTDKEKKDEENWFEKLYKLHNHLLKMCQEDDADYLEWLNDAYQKAYKEGIIELDDFNKYQEEVFSGLQDLFKDYLSDMEHEISMRENFDLETKKIISMYKSMISSVQKEIKAAREQGLDDTDDYIQELQSKYFDYVDAIKELEDGVTDTAKNAMEDIIDIRVDMLKDESDREKDELDKRLKNLKDFYDKQKKLLQDQNEDEDYIKEQEKKRKAVSDIQQQIAQLEYDNSAWAQRKKLELANDLADAQEELDEFEREHAIKLAEDTLDSEYELQEKSINDRLEQISDYQKNELDIRKEAEDDFRNGSLALFKQMLEWNREYGDGIDDTITDAWEAAYKSLEEYYALNQEVYKHMSMANMTDYKWNYGWDDSSVSGGKYGTVSALRKGYASGTRSASGGLHIIDEFGRSETIFESKDGSKYKMFSGGEKVLNAKASDFLYEFANGGTKLLTDIINSVTGDMRIDEINPVNNTEITMGDIIIHGNADRQTVSEIRRAQREAISDTLKSFNKLRR